MDVLEITEEEKEALEVYKGIGYKYVNVFLTDYIENDIEYAKLYNSREELEENIKKQLEKNSEIMKKIYSIMIKNILKNEKSFGKVLRGTSLEEVKCMQKSNEVNRLLSTTTNINTMKNFAYDTKNPAWIEIQSNEKIPYIKVRDVLGYERAGEDEIILSPFVNINSIEENGTQKEEGNLGRTSRNKKI